MTKWQKEASWTLAAIVALLLLFLAWPAEAHHHYTPPPAPVNNTTVNNYSVLPVGVALAAASGTCVKDWKPGVQKCVSWAMIDVEVDSDDDTVHAFGGGITTRVDQFAVHFYGGFENFGTDEEAILFTGSLNWR